MSTMHKLLYQNNALLAGVTVVTTALVFHVVQADDFSQRVYISGGLGITQLEPEGTTDAFRISDKSDAGGHLGLGYDINRFLSVEAYAATLGEADVEFLGVDAGSVDYTVFGLSALGYLYNSRSGFSLGDDDKNGLYRREGASLYARLGVGHLQNDSDRVEYRRDYPNHVAYGVGVEYGFDNGIALRTEVMALDKDAQYLNVGVVKRFGSAGALPAAALPAAALPVVAVEQPKVAAPVSAPTEPKDVATLLTPYIYFDFDDAVLSPESEQKLGSFVGQLEGTNADIIVEGHTDWLAGEEYNMSLSVRRAEAVANYLVSKGIPRNRLTTVGYGEMRPISDNDTEEGRALNRRSEIILQ